MLWLSQYYYMISLSTFSNIIIVVSKKNERKNLSSSFLIVFAFFFLFGTLITLETKVVKEMLMLSKMQYCSLCCSTNHKATGYL